mgnify:CR=1 FL=1|tara:strand:+ start:515 stop:982 length:468 start_codon:yes stop_codon:yes gene_type:complete
MKKVMMKGTITNLFDEVFNIQLPNKYINNGCISIGGVGSVVRQVHKQLKQNDKMNYEKLWVKTESYSGGNSVNIYLLNPTEETKKLSKSIMNRFQYGDFNGMIDLYEYNKDGNIKLILEDGQEIEVCSKYNFSRSEPPYGCKEYYEVYPQYKGVV